MGGPVVVVCGVSGTGKTTVGTLLAARLGGRYAEGDDFHPPANVAKMAVGVPLDDTDREPWLEAIAAWIGDRAAAGESAVVSCSALKRRYRDRLRRDTPGLWFVLLTGAPHVLAARLATRRGHFMPAGLLDSQLADLEPLGADEHGHTVDVAAPVEEVVGVVTEALPG